MRVQVYTSVRCMWSVCMRVKCPPHRISLSSLLSGLLPPLRQHPVGLPIQGQTFKRFSASLDLLSQPGDDMVPPLSHPRPLSSVARPLTSLTTTAPRASSPLKLTNVAVPVLCR